MIPRRLHLRVFTLKPSVFELVPVDASPPPPYSLTYVLPLVNFSAFNIIIMEIVIYDIIVCFPGRFDDAVINSRGRDPLRWTLGSTPDLTFSDQLQD